MVTVNAQPCCILRRGNGFKQTSHGKGERCKAVGKVFGSNLTSKAPFPSDSARPLFFPPLPGRGLPRPWPWVLREVELQHSYTITPVFQWYFTFTKRAVWVLHFQFISRILTITILGLPSLPSFTLTQTFHPIPDSKAKVQSEVGLGGCNSVSFARFLVCNINWKWALLAILRSGVPKSFGDKRLGPQVFHKAHWWPPQCGVFQINLFC